ncbi:MAG: YggT family protein [Gammaproteobacteria bacterium]|nr:YggT family protein [Gammaproteobacteria bacterium]
MGGGYVSNAGTFLIQTIFGLIMLVFMLRFLMQLVRADFYNPVSQFIVKVTNPVLVPMRRFIPGLFGIDMASVVTLILLQMAELFLVALVLGHMPQPMGLVVLSMAELLDLLINIYIFGILIQVILSWVNPGAYNPAVSILYSINNPLLYRARNLLPPVSGFDLSPILVMIGLQLISMLVVAPITDFGRSMF